MNQVVTGYYICGVCGHNTENVVEPIKEVCALRINIDELYKKWSGESHLEKSGLNSYDSSEVQDFGEYCIGEYKKWVELKIKE
jgi:hypothetical protein